MLGSPLGEEARRLNCWQHHEICSHLLLVPSHFLCMRDLQCFVCTSLLLCDPKGMQVFDISPHSLTHRTLFEDSFTFEKHAIGVVHRDISHGVSHRLSASKIVCLCCSTVCSRNVCGIAHRLHAYCMRLNSEILSLLFFFHHATLDAMQHPRMASPCNSTLSVI